MAQKDVPPDAAAQVLDRFTEVGLVDDAAYAELVVRSRHATRGLARPALAHELRGKGISPEVVEEALSGIDDADEQSAARALVTRKVATMGGLDPQRQRRRLVAMLGRRGYPPGLALAVVDEVLRREPRAGDGDRETDGEAGPD
jgi:regulatory protein